MKRKLLSLINACLQPFGLMLQRRGHLTRMRMDDGLKHLVKKGFQPSTCIDVGVGHGTPELYEAFPNVKHLLIEPLAEYAPEIKEIMKKYDCYYEQAAAGSKPGRLELYVKEQITGASMFAEKTGVPQGVKREVPVVTLDQICKEGGLLGPYVVKIDVEGAEMEVIKGAVAIMPDILAFVLELTFIARLVDAPEAGEIIAFMADRNFVLYDIFNLRVRDDQALFQADAVFVPERNPLRS